MKAILDACCGGREMWFNKHHDAALYIDIRKEGPGIRKERPSFEVNPDVIMDFRAMDFPDKTFKLVVWDPPHLATLGATSIYRKKYGCLNAQTWQSDLSKGFSECWRVLDDYGVLIFKWCDQEIPLKKLLELFGQQPLFGHNTGSNSKTYWVTFMKFPEPSTEPAKECIAPPGWADSLNDSTGNRKGGVSCPTNQSDELTQVTSPEASK